MKFLETKAPDANALIGKISSPDTFAFSGSRKFIKQEQVDAIWDKH